MAKIDDNQFKIVLKHAIQHVIDEDIAQTEAVFSIIMYLILYTTMLKYMHKNKLNNYSLIIPLLNFYQNNYQSPPNH